MTTQVKLAKQSLIAKHKLYRNTNKTVTNFFAYPQISQSVHVVSNCEIANNDSIEQTTEMPSNFRMQTKITPIFTKNHGYPRLVQEFQFFINDAIIKYTNVTTSMPDRKDDAFISQMSQISAQNNINDYYFDLGHHQKPEEGKIIDEEERINNCSNNCQRLHQPSLLPNLHNEKCDRKNDTNALFSGAQNKNHSKQINACVFNAVKTNYSNTNGQKVREGSLLSGISQCQTQILEGTSDHRDDASGDEGNFSKQEDNSEIWRGKEIPDNKEDKKEIFKVVKKRICKYDRKVNNCCLSKLDCKAH